MLYSYTRQCILSYVIYSICYLLGTCADLNSDTRGAAAQTFGSRAFQAEHLLSVNPSAPTERETLDFSLIVHANQYSLDKKKKNK